MISPYYFDFAELDKARQWRGHSFEAACAELRISRSTWTNWRTGRARPRPMALEAVRRYIQEAPRVPEMQE